MAASAKRTTMVAVTSLRQSDDAARGVGDAGGRTGHPDDGGEAEQKARGETGPGE